MDCVKHQNFLRSFLVNKFSVNGQFSQIFGCPAKKPVADHLQKVSSPGSSVKISAI